MRSDRQEAVDFQNQVCDEVLPGIRQHGLYATNEKLKRLITSPEFGIRLLSELKDEREARMRESALREQAVQAHQEEHEARMQLTVRASQAERHRQSITGRVSQAEHYRQKQKHGRTAPMADYCARMLISDATTTVAAGETGIVVQGHLKRKIPMYTITVYMGIFDILYLVVAPVCKGEWKSIKW
jgi:prophage antirepressor-like protein